MNYLKYIAVTLFFIFPACVFAATLKPEAPDFQKKVKTYYGLISQQKLDQAYAMKDDPKMTLNKFKQLYKDPVDVHPDRFKKIRNNVYSFRVSVLPEDERKVLEYYNVVMELRNGKLKTISAKKIMREVRESVKFNNSLQASIEWDNGFYKVFINKGGIKKLIAGYKGRGIKYVSYSKLKFSKKGLYLISLVAG